MWKEWFPFSKESSEIDNSIDSKDKDDDRKTQEYYANLIPNMFASIISKITRFFLGDSGNFPEERKTGYDIAEQIKSTLTEVSVDNPEHMNSAEKNWSLCL